MTKYMILYNGPATDMSDMSEEDGKAVMAKWGVWMEKVGKSLIDFGNPLANGVASVDDGSTGTATQLNGFSIIEAENLDVAKELVVGHPFLSEGKGNFKVEIHEMMPVPPME